MIRIMPHPANPPRRAATPLPWPPALEAMAERRRLAPGTALFRAGDPARHVFGLAQGQVALRRVGVAGEDIVIHLAQAGECFAEASLHGGHYHCTAEAVGTADVAAVPAEALRARLRDDPDFALQWSALLAAQLRRTRARVERLCLRSAADRVLHLLQTEGHGRDGAYTPRSTLRALAAELGLTPEALYRTLAALQRAGRLRRDGPVLRLR
ncbi:Crp/Fnr family transcriptional regulator [Rubrivivax albus]|uniref:Crp/Fnr family transcriptional regulator n=2 Tax=Rubrivivax albus TaxID=2499835 RepID=A0A3S2VX68_9BURK|nr:Crp/Fnr family transcriptional regulator [Rubrivivax albus]